MKKRLTRANKIKLDILIAELYVKAKPENKTFEEFKKECINIIETL